MFDELEKYKQKDHFFFMGEEEEIYSVCNAPRAESGVYIVYALQGGGIELVYIGSSGKVNNKGKIRHQLGGLYDEIVGLHMFAKETRKKTLGQKLKAEKIEALDVYWYVTLDSENMDIPLFVKATIMQRFYEMSGRLPRWNKEF